MSADVGQRLGEIREELIELHAGLDRNSVESDEVARLVTETRRSIERIARPDKLGEQLGSSYI